MCLGILLVRIPHHVLNEKSINGYTGNYEDVYFRGLLSILEILEIFILENNSPYGICNYSTYSL